LIFNRCCQAVTLVYHVNKNIAPEILRALFSLLIAILPFLFLPPLETRAVSSLDHFDFSTITAPKVGYVAFRAIINARAANNTLVRTFTGSVTLTAADANGPIPVEALSPLKFTSGQWVGLISINTTDATSVTLTVSDFANHRGTAGPITLLAPTFHVIDQPIISLVSDRARSVLYGTLANANPFARQIAVIDPVTESVRNVIPVSGGAGRLEIAADESVLYVVTDDGLHVRRLGLPDFTEELVLDLGESEPGVPNYADDIAVAPDRPDVVAISKQRHNLSPRFSGLSVYDNGVEKQPLPPFFTQANVVAFGASADRLYSYNSETTGYSLIGFNVTAAGLETVSSIGGLITGFDADLYYKNGLLYATTGRIVDPETFTLLGEIQNGDPDALMLPLPSIGRVVYTSPAALGVLSIFDLGTLRTVGTIPFPAPRGAGSGLVGWGDRGIAFHDGVRLYLLESEFLPNESSSDLEVTPVTTRTGTVAIGVDTPMEVSIRNIGPNTANSVVVLIDGLSGTVLTSAAAEGANCTVTDQQVRCERDSLASGASFHLTFQAHANSAAWHPFNVTVTSRAIDLNGTNNFATVVLTAAPLSVPESFAQLRITTTDIVVDRSRGKIVASSSAQSGAFAQSIITIDPLKGEIAQPVFVGNRPSKLSLSDDGNYLYVGYAGLGEVRRFKLPQFEQDLTIPLGFGFGFGGVRFADDLAVRPGHSSDLLILRSLDGGLAYMRDDQTLSDGLGQGTVDFIQFPSATRLYGCSISFGLFTLEVTDTGLQSLGFKSGINQVSGGFIVADARVYFSNGSIFNADTGQSAGTFNGLTLSAASPYVDPITHRALFVERSITNSTLAAYDTATLARVGSFPLAGVTGSASSIRRWGTDGIAFRSTSGIAIVRTTLAGIPEQPPRFDGITSSGGNIILHFTATTPGQYQLEYTPQIGMAFSAQGAPFSETNTQVQITAPSPQGFFRIVRLP
jgi:hypothetical protein